MFPFQSCLLKFIISNLVACICKKSNDKSSTENHRLTELNGVKYKNEGPRIKQQEKKTEGVDNKGYKDEETDIKYNTTKVSEKLKNYDDVNADWMFADRLHKSAHKVSI